MTDSAEQVTPVGFIYEDGRWSMFVTGPDAALLTHRMAAAQRLPWAIGYSPDGADPRRAIPGLLEPPADTVNVPREALDDLWGAYLDDRPATDQTLATVAAALSQPPTQP